MLSGLLNTHLLIIIYGSFDLFSMKLSILSMVFTPFEFLVHFLDSKIFIKSATHIDDLILVRFIHTIEFMGFGPSRPVKF